MISNKPILVPNQNWRELVPSTEKHFNASYEKAMSFPKVNGIIESEKYVKMVDCACCGSSNSRQIFVKWNFIHSECNNCDHIYVKNQLRKEILFDLYETSIKNDLGLERQSNPHQKSYWLQVYEKYLMGLLTDIDQDGRSLLDVGCGVGNFLELAKHKTSMEVFASEFSEAAHEKLKKLIGDKLFYKMELSDIEQQTDKKFDLIFFWGVLEHLTNPVKNLIAARKLLKVNGQILALVPNFHSRAMQILGVNTPTLNPVEHLQFFSKSSMNKCAEKACLKVEKKYQELPIIDLMHPNIKFSESLVLEIMEKKEAYYDIYIFQHV